MSRGTRRLRTNTPLGVSVVVAASLLRPSAACAGDEGGRFSLPEKLVLTIASSALEAHRPISVAWEPAAAVPGAPKTRQPPKIVPRAVHIPDAYSLEYDRDPPRFAEPVNRNNMVKVDIPGPRPDGWRTFLSFDEQSRGPVGRSDNLMRLVVEHRW
jgi:hypothetical protein